MAPDVAISIVGPDEIDLLGRLFGTARTTRHCWCTAFCSTRLEFTRGWFGGGNRRRFQRLAQGGAPMGLVALVDSAPVGWAACGPRSRYRSSPEGARLLRARPAAEDDTSWLLPCLYVDPEHRGRGVSHTLVTEAVGVARRHRAVALESWPLAGPVAGPSADAFVGREGLFADRGFSAVERPEPQRVIMRLDFAVG